MSPLFTWLILQGVAWLLAMSWVQDWLPQALLQMLLVQLMRYLCCREQPWMGHLLLSAALALGLHLGLSPIFCLSFFLLLWLSQGRVDKDRVPFYLSAAECIDRLDAVLVPGQRCIDLGCATGGLLQAWARRHPEVYFEGVEQSWLWSALARWRCRRLPNCRIRQGNLWDVSLSGFDLVYAFLSPAPMPRLWHKACTEMHAGSLLISNSFAIPGQPYHELWPLSTGRLQTQLYVYVIEADPDTRPGLPR